MRRAAEKAELTALVVDHAAVGLLGGQRAGRAVVGKLRHVAAAGARARPAGGAAGRPGHPLGHGAGGGVWGENPATDIWHLELFAAFALTDELEVNELQNQRGLLDNTSYLLHQLQVQHRGTGTQRLNDGAPQRFFLLQQ